MQNYQLTIENIFVNKGKLNIKVTARLKHNINATVPKIRLLFCAQGQTRRLPLPISECTVENGICTAVGEYSYNLYYLFYNQGLTEPVHLSFDIAYGADEYIKADFTVNEYDRRCLKIDGN